MTRSHMRNGRGGACVPARTSAQRRFHPQRARSPPAKEAFPFINDACSHQNMFVHLPMDAPLQGDAVGHTGTDPTNLHQTSLPRNLLHLVHRRTILRQSYNASHTRNGRGGACVPARTSAQRRFHPQKARPHAQRRRFHLQKVHSTRKSGISIHKRCMLTPKHVCAFADGCALAGRHGRARRHRPYPPSIKSLCHATFLDLLCRRIPRRQPSCAFVHRRSFCRRHATRCGGQRGAPGNIAVTDVAR